MEYPLKDIPQPYSHDVLCGRGGGTNNHVGNAHWRMLVAANKELYVTLPKRQKMLLSKSIVNAVRSQAPPGRFLQKDSKTDKWYDVGDQRAQEKTSQALREGAPTIREKVQSPSAATYSHLKESTLTGTCTGAGTGTDTSSYAPALAVAPDPEPELELEPVAQSQPTTKMHGDGTAVTSASGVGSGDAYHHQHQEQQHQEHHYQQHHQEHLYQQHRQEHHYQQHQQHQPPMMVMPPQAKAQYPAVTHHAGYQVRRTMAMNDQGVMVPAQVVIPPSIPAPIPAQGPLSGRKGVNKSSATSNFVPNTPADIAAAIAAVTSSMSGLRQKQQQPPQTQPQKQPQKQPQQQPQQQYDQQQHDDYVEPPAPLDPTSGFSFGSINMSDYEQTQLEGGVFSFGSVMSYAPADGDQVSGQAADPMQQQQQQQQQPLLVEPPARNSNSGMHVNFAQDVPDHDDGQYHSQQIAPVDGGLEPAGLSIGSMMSIGDAKLESAGLSFGSMMSGVSIKDTPHAVNGGLENIGTSFGSLSLAPEDQTRLFSALLADQGSVEAAPQTLLYSNKSKGSLLDCSDTDSDVEEESGFTSSVQKSAEYEKLKATVLAQHVSQSGSAAAGVPPPLFPGSAPATLNIPSETTFQRDFSQMSAISVGEDFAETVIPGHRYAGVGEGGFSSEMPPPAAMFVAGDDVDGMPPPPPIMQKQTSEEEWEQFEIAYLNRGNSLAEDFANR